MTRKDVYVERDGIQHYLGRLDVEINPGSLVINDPVIPKGLK